MTDDTTGWQEATIEECSILTPTVMRVVLRPQAWRALIPGQHIDVRLTAADGYSARRSYSVTSAPAMRSTFELAIERLPDGEVSSWFHEVAQPGDTVEVNGPFAEHFVWRGEADGHVFLVGGGSGVAPLMAMVRTRSFLRRPPPMTLLYSARTWQDVLYRDELLAQERAQQDLRVVFCLTRDQTRRPQDFARRIDAELIASVLAASTSAPDLCFVCGSNAFAGAVADLLVAAGVDPVHIRTERFGTTRHD
jgi:ferredoxin-NADP reductase